MDGQELEIFEVPLEGDGSKGYLPEMEQEEPRFSGQVLVKATAMKVTMREVHLFGMAMLPVF